MTAFTNFLELELLDHLLNDNQYTLPTAKRVWIGLATDTGGPFTEAGGGTELSGNGYARVLMDSAGGAGGNKWTVASGQASNAVAVTFPVASGNWGTVRYIGIFDASTAGNLLVYGQLTTDRLINSGDTLEFAIGDLKVTLD